MMGRAETWLRKASLLTEVLVAHILEGPYISHCLPLLDTQAHLSGETSMSSCVGAKSLVPSKSA